LSCAEREAKAGSDCTRWRTRATSAAEGVKGTFSADVGVACAAGAFVACAAGVGVGASSANEADIGRKAETATVAKAAKRREIRVVDMYASHSS
jgi:hypothetical protein